MLQGNLTALVGGLEIFVAKDFLLLEVAELKIS